MFYMMTQVHQQMEEVVQSKKFFFFKVDFQYI